MGTAEDWALKVPACPKRLFKPTNAAMAKCSLVPGSSFGQNVSADAKRKTFPDWPGVLPS